MVMEPRFRCVYRSHVPYNVQEATFAKELIPYSTFPAKSRELRETNELSKKTPKVWPFGVFNIRSLAGNHPLPDDHRYV